MYQYTGRNQEVVYNRYGVPAYLGKGIDFSDQKFLITSAAVAAGTVAVLVYLKKRKRRKK